MTELIQISEHDYYIEGPTRIGIVKIATNEVVLIDSGCDKSIGKAILKVLEENNWNLNSILLTHSHADHIGGNKYIQDRTNCHIFANGIETAYCNYPILEPIGLCGAMPLEELRCKFLEAQPSFVQYLSQDNLPGGIKVINLPGHTSDMVGYLTVDGTFFIGDSLISEENLIKHPISYLTEVQPFIETLEKLKQFDAKNYVPSHAPATTNIKALAQKNIDIVLSNIELIFNLLKEPRSFEALLGLILKHFGIPGSVVQYFLIGSTIRAYLNHLLNQKRIKYYFDDTTMLFVATQE